MFTIYRKLLQSAGTIVLLFSLSFAKAQNVIKAEYFIDTDPGFNNGTNIPVTQGTDVTANFQLPVTSLSLGFHNLYTRAYIAPYTVTSGANQGPKGGWSLTASRVIYKENIPLGQGALANIVKGEYFYDTDPGIGRATAISFTQSTDVTNVTFTSDITDLSLGFHYIYVRFLDANGHWSLTTSRVLYKELYATQQDAASPVVAGEYYIDTDPGRGHGKSISLSQGTDITNIAFTADITAIGTGFHNISVRFKNAIGLWSLTSTRSFYKEQIQVTGNPASIVKIEQFLDTDPGFGNANNVPFTSGANVTVNFMVDLTGQPIGNHTLYVRALDANGKWSLLNNADIHICAPAILSSTHTDQSNCNTNDGTISLIVSGGTGPFTYVWSNGDTTKNISNLAPGNYTVTVTDAQPCPASLTVAILPAAVINLKMDSVNTSCGNNNGSATVSVTSGGKAPYIYLWNNGATTASITGLAAGTYSVTVTDSNNCKATSHVNIDSSVATAVPVLTVTQPAPCTNAGTTITSGTADSYVWSTGDTTQSIIATVSGTYKVTVTTNGCSASDSVAVITSNGNKTTLTYTGITGFTNSVVNPISGGPTSIFRFEVRYTNASGIFPATNPKVLLDYEGNGSFDDPNDRLFYMQEKNPNDLDVKDGKDYYFITSALAESPDWKTTIAVTDQAGCSTQFGAFSGPAVTSAADISIFANDISFSNPKPDTSSQVTVYATIHNNSSHDADNFTVHLVNQFQPNVVYPDIVVPHLSSTPGFNTAQVSWNITTPSQPAWCPMQVFVDYSNVLQEPNELDNQAIRPFTNGKFTLPGDIKITAEANPAAVLVGNSFSVAGVAAYRNTAVPLTDPSCAGATVTATLVETNQLSYGYTNSKGEYSIGLAAPATPGTYHVKVNITDFTLDGDTTSDLTTYEIIVPPCVGPDLVSSVKLSPGTIVLPGELEPFYSSVILQGQKLAGTATVTNVGNARASAHSILQFELPDGTPVPGTFDIGPLDPGQSQTVQLDSMTFTRVGTTYIRANADYNNSIVECDELHNSSVASILVLPPLPDITPDGNGINGTSSAYQCQFNSISFGIRNIGGVATDSFNAKLTVTHNSSVVAVINKTVGSIDPLQGTGVTFDFTPSDIGAYNFFLQCDIPNAVTEVNENNNDASVTVNMLQCLPDLYVEGCGSMHVQPVDPVSPGNITIYATVANGGQLAANVPFTVDFNVAGTHYSTQLNGTINPGGGSQEVSVTVPAPAYGNNQLIVTADATNVIAESAENNNSTPGSLCWDFSLTNAPCSDRGVLFISPIQYVGRPVKLATGLFNHGLYEASHAQVKFEVSGPGITGWLDLGYASTFAGNTCACPIPTVLPGQFAFPQIGHYQVRITADFNNQYTECDETNNQLIVDITVSNQPDYFVKSEYIAPSLLNPDVDQPVTFDISYENLGEGNADSMEVFTEVDEIALDSVQAPGVLGGKTNSVHMNQPWSSSIRGVHIIRAIVDHDNEIAEPDELNNEATRAIVVGHAPNLKFDAFSASNPAPLAGSAININATIHNNGYTGCYATYQLFYVDNSNAEVLIGQKSIAVDSGGILHVITPWVVTNSRATLIARIINANPIEYDATDNEDTLKLNKLMLTVSSPKPACSLDSNGIAKVSIVGGLAPYSAIWSNGMTGDSIRVPAGTYNVQVTDAEGSTVTSDSITIDEASSPVVSFTGLASNYLVNDPPATLTGNPSGGIFTGTGISGNQFSPSSAGVGGPYTITYAYTTPEGCSGSDTHTTTVSDNNNQPPAPTTSVVNNCGNSMLTAENYTGTLHWSTGETTASITVTTAGDYTVTQTVNGVTSDPGQATSAPKVVPSKPVITPNGPTSFCEGGSVTLSSTPNNAYQWYKDDQIIADAIQQQYTASSTGAYKVEVTNVQSCSSTSDAIQVTASPKPTAAISYTGSPYCNSGTATVTQTGTTGGTYSSTLGLSINSSTGAISLSQSTPGSYTVTYSFSSNGCPNSTTADVVIKTVPAAPSSITGSSALCAGATNVAYTASAVSGATSYTWTVPGGWTITGGQSTSSINVTAGSSGGSITVTANNTCGSSTARILAVSVSSAPATPGTISGPASSCAGVNNLTYSISAVSGATSYSWTVPSGWSINGSASGTSISVSLGTSAPSGNVSVSAVNGCGTSAARSLAVTVNALPSTPGPISGNTTVCAASTQTYSIAVVSGATSYTWIVPSGWTIKKNTSTSISVSVKAGTASGIISVKANNSCGASAASTLTVTVIIAPATPGTISGNTSVCAFNAATYSTAAVSSATLYTWTVPKGWIINSGQGTTSIQVTSGKAGQKGNIGVTASNGCGTSSTRTLAVTSVTCATLASNAVAAISAEKTAQNLTVKVSPNPAVNTLHLELYGYAGYVTIQMITLQGKVLMQSKMQTGYRKYAQEQLNIGNITSGVYFLVVIDDKGNWRTEKVVVAR